ncbi:MAG: hypothetical protein PHT07_15670 [Paludibacter sp.]|nr:hypothetical protein [Paludibacter sp.]
MKKQHFILLFLATLSNSLFCQSTTEKGKPEKTVFQTSQPWRSTIDNRGDVAIIYGIGGNPSDHKKQLFEERVNSWREHGYTTHFMTGIAWGEYKDYFTGAWDGKSHLDEGQVQQNGDTIWHGHLVPYIVPTENFLKYIKEEHIKRVIDAGIDAIYLEEPEFWARSGYSDAFKREWKKYYHFDWRPQHESAENTYLSNKLKYQLYYKALENVFTYAKAYGKSKGMNVRCYVPTHSLINYSQWMIVSPEASLASMACVDGYIAQIWTGTSREPNYYNGLAKERVFETAFLEYGSMESMTAPTGRKLFFLTDPIEDRSKDWVDYKKNYEATFTAQLLYPNIANFEIMPWPERIYQGLYRTSANSQEKKTIPRFYSTQMQVMVNSLNQMPSSENKVNGSAGICILMSNTLMFQRFPTHDGYEDPQLSNFYGQALPLLKRGIPVKTLHIENAAYPETWKEVSLLIMSYSNMKPLDPLAHKHIADWVRKGGVLVYCGRDNDPFQTVQEWWNTDNNTFKAPSEHLFKELGLANPLKDGVYSVGKGKVCVIRKDPKELVLTQKEDQAFVDRIQNLYENNTAKGKLEFKNYFYLNRGPFEIISVMDENVNDKPFVIKGKFIDLFDPKIPVLNEKTVLPGEQAYLFNINRVQNPLKPQVLAAASRIYDESRTKHRYSFIAKSPVNTTNVMRVLLPSVPKKVTITDAQGIALKGTQNIWDASSRTCFLSFENNPDGIRVVFVW